MIEKIIVNKDFSHRIMNSIPIPKEFCGKEWQSTFYLGGLIIANGTDAPKKWNFKTKRWNKVPLSKVVTQHGARLAMFDHAQNLDPTAQTNTIS